MFILLSWICLRDVHTYVLKLNMVYSRFRNKIDTDVMFLAK